MENIDTNKALLLSNYVATQDVHAKGFGVVYYAKTSIVLLTAKKRNENHTTSGRLDSKTRLESKNGPG